MEAPAPGPLLAAAELPRAATGHSQVAWCAASNLVAVAGGHDAEAGQEAVASVLVLEPSRPEDCTALEVPLEGASPPQARYLLGLFKPWLARPPAHRLSCRAWRLPRQPAPLPGARDTVSSVQWSWPGQRRALLTATASGRVVAWTQPAQGHASQVWHFPRGGHRLRTCARVGAGPRHTRLLRRSSRINSCM
jgi:hypothetical protein